MKVITEIKKRKIPIVRVDNSLKKYDDKILFPDKLEKANEMLKKIGLPKQWMTVTNHGERNFC
jgi:hypothetical protein